MTTDRVRGRGLLLLRALLVTLLAVGVLVLHSVSAHHGAGDGHHGDESGAVAHDAEPAAGLSALPTMVVGATTAALDPLVGPDAGLSSVPDPVVGTAPSPPAERTPAGLAPAVLTGLTLLLLGLGLARGRVDRDADGTGTAAVPRRRRTAALAPPLAARLARLSVLRI